MQDIVLGGHRIGAGQPPFIIAEMSGNHGQSLERALAIVDAAADAGCQGLKIQTSTPDMLTLDSREPDFVVRGANQDWEGQSLYELYTTNFTPFEWHAAIFARAQERGMVGFSSPFGIEAIEFLESVGCPAYKIASFENNWPELIRRAAQTGKPIIISTGMADLADLERMVAIVRAEGNEQLVLLKCTSTYPAEPHNTNLRTIPHLRELFNCQVGLSDHTLGTGVGVAATVLGATVIEKHLTLDRADGGPDASFSLEPAEMARLVQECRQAQQALGSVFYGPTQAEQKSLAFRRSIYVVQDVAEGEILTADNVRVIRPGNGLPPHVLPQVIGRPARHSVRRGTALNWDMV
ncbi:pseudaminic acid synthase [Hymenobacter ginsengisoli]|uniref:Pseudaminic acid synthase n=1 Tax=Hymenobacter ginsengisoli TaxID=1051626 RepID=A0ABP8QMK5_9BACT|nr:MULTISPECIES: pseudaminic acid synthase [unclassified Hymenobacter]MBO2031207.1 pseudaminic acid synthase [Hymenobacter sp. BT559]